MRINGHSAHLDLFTPANRESPPVAVSYTSPAPEAFAHSASTEDRDPAVRETYLFAASHRIVARVAEGLDQAADL